MTVYIYFIWGKYLAQTIFNMQVSSEVFDKPDTGTLQQYYYFRTLNSKFEVFDKTTPCTSSVTHVWLTSIFWACILKTVVCDDAVCIATILLFVYHRTLNSKSKHWYYSLYCKKHLQVWPFVTDCVFSMFKAVMVKCYLPPLPWFKHYKRSNQAEIN